MKKLFTLCFVAMTAFFGVALTSCNNDKNDTNGVDTFDIEECLYTAARSYVITDSTADFVSDLTISASVQWPKRLGDYDIKALQDTILAIAFQKPTSTIGDAIAEFIDDTDSYDLGDKVEVVDTVNPDGYLSQVNVRVIELTKDIATYSVLFFQSMGGAHPMAASIPFTFDLETGSMVTYGTLFKEGSEEILLLTIRDLLPEQTGMTRAELNQMLLGDLTISENVYLQNSNIVFHYNPYEILPYSVGAIDVEVSPYLVSDLLTPRAAKLLLD